MVKNLKNLKNLKSVVNYIIILMLLVIFIKISEGLVCTPSTIVFKEMILETCKAQMVVDEDTAYEAIYNDLEFLLFYEESTISDSLFYYFDSWKLSKNPERCVLLIDNNWVNCEMINGELINGKKKIKFTILITYSEDTKNNLYNTNSFPLLYHLNKITFVLNEPFNTWRIESSNIVKDVESITNIFDNLVKIRKSTLLMTIDKKYFAVYYIKDDYWTNYYNYSLIFSDSKRIIDYSSLFDNWKGPFKITSKTFNKFYLKVNFKGIW